MVAKIFCILIFVVLCEPKKSLVPQAILQLVQSNYGERPVEIEIFYNSRKVKILDETLKLLSSEKNINVTPINTKKIDYRKFDFGNCSIDDPSYCFQSFLNNAIFLFDTVDSYHRIEGKFKRPQFFKTNLLNHFVYSEDASEKNIQKIITRDTYESFLIEKNCRISLYTMTMFTENKCRAAQLIEINQFSSLERKWTTEKFFRPRIENFHGCELWLNLTPTPREPGMPFLGVRLENGQTVDADGAIVDMLDTLSTYLNFTYIHGTAVIEKAKSSGLGDDIETVCDFPIQAIFLEIEKSLSSDPIFSLSDVFVVPPGELYTSWEKLLMPFDWQSWMWLGITFAVALFFIVLIKLRRSGSIYEFVIGSNVTTPSLNVIAIFMGIGQILLPERNVARFFFMSFILFSLIMRTAYQGKYFEFLTSVMRKKPIQTIEELKDKNFTAILNVNQHYCVKEFLESKG